jgi:hypothetical protein
MSNPVFEGLAQGLKPDTLTISELALIGIDAKLNRLEALQERIADAAERQADAAERAAAAAEISADALEALAAVHPLNDLLDKIAAAVPPECRTRAVVKRPTVPVWLEGHLNALKPGSPTMVALESAERILRVERERAATGHMRIPQWTTL